MKSYRNFPLRSNGVKTKQPHIALLPVLLMLFATVVPLFGQISFSPRCLYNEPGTCYELTDVIATPGGNLKIAWAFWNNQRGGSKVQTISPYGEFIGDPVAIRDVPLDELGCKPMTQIAERTNGAWAGLTVYS
jgi:hypothetical protein